jgi:TonB family protein
VSGKAEETRTVNTKALFKMSKSGADRPANAGNPYAKRDTIVTAAGTGGGLNPAGNDALDEGLQGRGLVGSLPQPIYPAGNKSGRVVIRVKVNQAGQVIEAVFNPNGSTTTDSALIEAAIDAARKARFTESRAFIQGGEISYIFKMK